MIKIWYFKSSEVHVFFMPRLNTQTFSIKFDRYYISIYMYVYIYSDKFKRIEWNVTRYTSIKILSFNMISFKLCLHIKRILI